MAKRRQKYTNEVLDKDDGRRRKGRAVKRKQMERKYKKDRKVEVTTTCLWPKIMYDNLRKRHQNSI